MSTRATDARLGARMASERERRGLSVDAAAAEARVGATTWEAVEEFDARACTTVTLARILDWLNA
jgi:hypothetical protein